MISKWLPVVVFAGVVVGQNAITSSTAAAAGASAPASTTAGSSTSASNTYPTATILLQGNVTTGFAAAYHGASACSTTYTINCTATDVCSSAVAAVTQGPFEYIITMHLSESGTSEFISERCSLERLDAAVCTDLITVTAGGATATYKETSSPSGASLQYLQIPITAGRDRFDSAGASACTSSALAGKSSDTTSASSNGGSTNTTAVGVGVGVGLGGALLLGGLGAFFLLRRRKRRQRKDSAPPAYGTVEKRSSSDVEGQPQQTSQVQEVPADSPIVELPNGEQRVELGDKSEMKGPAQSMSPQELPGDAGQLK